MKLRLLFFASAALFIASCGSNKGFNKKRHGHRNWVKVESNLTEDDKNVLVLEDEKRAPKTEGTTQVVEDVQSTAAVAPPLDVPGTAPTASTEESTESAEAPAKKKEYKAKGPLRALPIPFAKVVESQTTTVKRVKRTKGNGGSTGDLLLLALTILAIVLVIVLLDSLLGGWLGWLIMTFLVILLILFLLRYIGIL